MSLVASTLPSNDGYVAAAYIVFFALILIYVAIMAVRLGRVERKLRNMQSERDEDRPPSAEGASDADEARPSAAERDQAPEREREAV